MKKHLGSESGDGYNFYFSGKRNDMYHTMVARFGKQKVDEELARARQLFRKYDTNRSGYLERHEIVPMMKDSYKLLRKNFEPTNEDVEQYMRLIDTSHDNRISLEEYELYILRSLQNRPLHI